MLDVAEEGKTYTGDFIPRKALSSSEGRRASIGGDPRLVHGTASDFDDFFDGAGLRGRAILKPWRNMAENGVEYVDESLVGMSRYICVGALVWRVQ